MRIEYSINGSVEVPPGAEAVQDASNLFQLPTGQVISVHPVIEMTSAIDRDDHRDLTTVEASAVGIHLDLYDRASTLADD